VVVAMLWGLRESDHAVNPATPSATSRRPPGLRCLLPRRGRLAWELREVRSDEEEGEQREEEGRREEGALGASFALLCLPHASHWQARAPWH
jgi:hypothetical protein